MNHDVLTGHGGDLTLNAAAEDALDTPPTICTSKGVKLYEDGLNSGVPAVTDIVCTAVQNVVDTFGAPVGDTMTPDQEQVFFASVESELSIRGIAESALRWFALHGIRA